MDKAYNLPRKHKDTKMYRSLNKAIGLMTVTIIKLYNDRVLTTLKHIKYYL